MENRISVKLKNPNPLFVKWLEEWRDQAKEKNSKTQHAYSLALSSLRKYPLPLERGRDCKILKGFGTTVCDMLDKALEKYKNEQSGVSADTNTDSEVKTKTRKSASSKKLPLNNENDNCDNYVPAYRSGAYAILVTLYEKSLENNYQGFMLKKDLIKEAQNYCDTSFTKAPVGSFYTAWSSMKTLLAKKLVHKEGNPAKFSLTDTGNLLGCKLYTKTDSMIYQASSSSSFVENNLNNRKNSNELVVLSDSDEEMNKLECVSDKKNSAVSDELKKICGVYSTENNVKLQKKVCENRQISREDSKEENFRTKSSENLEVEDYIMAPHSFDIILFVDTQETSG